MTWREVAANHGMRALSGTVAAMAMLLVRVIDVQPIQLRDLIAILVGTLVMVVMEEGLGLLPGRRAPAVKFQRDFSVDSRPTETSRPLPKAPRVARRPGVFLGQLVGTDAVVVADLAASRSMAHDQATWQLGHHPLTQPRQRAGPQAYVDRLRRLGARTSACLVYLTSMGSSRQ